MADLNPDYSRDVPAWWSDPAVIGNPLAMGAFCPDCQTRLQTDPEGNAKPCPFAPHEETAA